MGQEPGTNEEIKKFAAGKGFSGVLMDKVRGMSGWICPNGSILKSPRPPPKPMDQRGGGI